jgi:Glycosyl transferase family 2
MAIPDTISLIVEWDNVRFADIARGQRVLEVLGGQMQEIPGTCDISILYNEHAMDGSLLQQVADRTLGHMRSAVQLIPTPGLAYYQLKNEGARRTHGSIIVFVDSDVIPEAGWLRQLLRSFTDPGIDVVAGNTYIEYNGLYSKAMALGWMMFPARSSDGWPSPNSWFFANNVAFRRSIFEQHPFPDDTMQFRGQCYRLAQRLQAHGIEIYMHPSARAAHPAPRGIGHFIRTAICEGHDRFQFPRMAGVFEALTFRAIARRFRSDLRQAWRGVGRRRREVGVAVASLPVALAVVTSFYTLCCVGEILARWAPSIVRRHFAL